MLFGSASGDATITNGNYYSWSIGEVIVFNDLNNPATIAQSMQSYINPPKLDDCLKVTIISDSIQLCSGTIGFQQSLSYGFTPATAPVSAVQWYYSKTKNDTAYARIITAPTSTLISTYKPYFPGYYKVCLTSKVLGCTVCSAPTHVQILSSPFTVPQISPNGTPATSLSISYDTQTLGAATLQWYAFIPTLNKYLLVVGGNQADLKVRYDGDYMAIVSYANGCKLSAASGVTGYNRPLYRASDTKIDGNTIYIPDEVAYESSALKIFPNPALGSFTVQFESSREIVSKGALYSNTGLLVKDIPFVKGEFWSKTAIIDAADLSAGVYFLKVNEGDRQIVQKVVLQK